MWKLIVTSPAVAHVLHSHENNQKARRGDQEGKE